MFFCFRDGQASPAIAPCFLRRLATASALGRWENDIVPYGTYFVEPCSEDVDYRLAKRHGAPFASLAEDFDMSARAERHVLALKARHLREPEACL